MDRRPSPHRENWAAWVSSPVVWTGCIARRTPRGSCHRLLTTGGGTRAAHCVSHPVRCAAAQRCRPPPGELAGGRPSSPGGGSLACAPPSVDGAWPSARKMMAANSVRCPRDRGESVKGGLPPPFHKKGNDQSELAAARRRRAREFRFPSQERLGVGSPDPSPPCSGLSVRLSPHFGRPVRSAGRFGSRRAHQEN